MLTRRSWLNGLAAAVVVKDSLLASTSEHRIVVVGSENRTAFAVIDITNPQSPNLSYIDPGFGAGVRVALNKQTVAAGSVLSGAVRLVSLTGSAATLRGTFQTKLSGIGAIAARGSLVAVGEAVNSYKARVSIVDFSNPDSPSLFASAQTPLVSASTTPDKPLSAITNLAFVSDRQILLSGQNDFRIVAVDFSTPGSPVVSTFLPHTGNPPVLDVDAASNTLVVGDSGGRLVKVFNATTFAEIASIPTSQASVNSLAVSSAGFALAAGLYSFTLDKVDLFGMTSSSFAPKLGGGLITAVDDLTGVCGEINGSKIALIDFTSTPYILSVVDSTLPSISTLATGLTSAQAPVPAQLSFSPPQIVFPMTRLTSTAVLKIQNTGGTMLSLRNIRTNNTHFYAGSTGFDVLVGATQTLTLKFVANGANGRITGDLLFSTNDPATQNASIPLSCVIGVS